MKKKKIIFQILVALAEHVSLLTGLGKDSRCQPIYPETAINESAADGRKRLLLSLQILNEIEKRHANRQTDPK